MGDDITSQLNFSNFSVSEPKYNLYKTKGESHQKKRRDEYLQNLKNRRRDLTQYARALALDTPIPEEPDELPLRDEEVSGGMEVEQTVPVDQKEQQTAPKKTGREKYLNQLMLAEPLVDIPGDLKEGWFAVPIPAGVRCMVISARNSTIARLKSGAVINKFVSGLPSGAPGSRGKVNEYCILDCIFNEATATYYVVDIMCWKAYSLYNCATDFRFYWKSTKLDETKASVAAANNPYKFLPLPYYACDVEGLRNALALKQGGLDMESVVFYSKETDYTLGHTPLVCTLELTTEEGRAMAQRLLNGESSVMQ